MLKNNSNNTTIFLECLLSTRARVCVCVCVCACVCVCVCVCTKAQYLPGMHQDTIDNPSHKLPVSVLRCFVSPRPLSKPPCTFASK